MELSNELYYSLYENSIYIYIIRQDCGKYFIWKTNTPTITINDIQNLAKKNKQKWLITYKPIQIQEIIHSLDTWDEDKITLKYMDKYGVDNVRGGAFNSVILGQDELTTIRNMISTAKGICIICDSTRHIKTNCPMISEFKDYEIIIKNQDEVIISPHNQPSYNINNNNNNVNNTNEPIQTIDWQNTVLSVDSIKSSFSSALFSVANATNSIWQSLLNYGGTGGPNQIKCLRCGYKGHKTGQCVNEIHKIEDSLIFPDNKSYNPIFKPSV